MAKQRAVAVDPQSGTLLQLIPDTILADDNTRFGLKQSRIESLAKSIAEQGGVMEPVEVEPLAASENGHHYRLTTGFYRHAAVALLNTQGAGLTVPAIVRPTADSKERIRRQVAENLERENLSPIDQGVAIKRLLSSGLTKMEVREIFGGRKGKKQQPASNSFINMTLSFLDLPKAIQDKIHNGLVGVAAAYELTKIDPEKRAQVLERAEKERQTALEREEKDEEKYLAQEKKQNEAQAKRDEMSKAVAEADTKRQQALGVLETKTATAVDAHKLSIAKHPDAKTKKAATTAFREAEKARLVAEADVEEAQKEYEVANKKFTSLETLAAEKAAKLKEARSKTPQGAAAQKGEAVSGADVKKAAVREKASKTYVALTAKEMRDTASALALPGGEEKVMAIGNALVKCFAGEITEKELYKTIEKIVS